jgi:hypothetical protein
MSHNGSVRLQAMAPACRVLTREERWKPSGGSYLEGWQGCPLSWHARPHRQGVGCCIVPIGCHNRADDDHPSRFARMPASPASGGAGEATASTRRRLSCAIAQLRARPAGESLDCSWRSMKGGFLELYWSERRDLNSRPPVPQTGALTGLRYAPPNGPAKLGLGWASGPFIYARVLGRARAGRETTMRPQSAPRTRK